MATFDINKIFISKILHERDITEVADIPSYFIDEGIYRDAFEYIRQYYAEHTQVPTIRVFQADCPKAVLVNADEPWSDIIKRVNEKYVNGIFNVEMSKVVGAYEAGDTDSAINFLGVLVSKVHTAVPNKRDVDVTQTGDERLARYQERRDNPGTLVGIPSGFPTIDRATQGFQEGQLVTVTGLTKASKSALAMLFAMSAQEHGKKVMYLTYEMTVDEQTNRLDAYRAGINDNKLNNGDLSSENMASLKKGIHVTENLPAMMISEDCMTVTAIGAKCDTFDPDIIIVDGTYMLEDEHGEAKGSPQALSNIVSGLKFLAMRRKICVIAVTQSTPARTKGETLNNDSIMGSRAFAQYSNVVIGIERTEDAKMRKLRIILSRSCAPCDTMLEFDFDTAVFQEIEGYDMDEELEKMLENEMEDNF